MIILIKKLIINIIYKKFLGQLPTNINIYVHIYYLHIFLQVLYAKLVHEFLFMSM